MRAEPDAVKTARTILAVGLPMDADAYADQLSRAVIAQHEELETLKAALCEALDWATPFDHRHSAQGGYESELMPMFVRIGERRRDERIADLLKLVGTP
jgi:hypothetical protein